MSESFDAYHEWLAIAPKDQPPNCYRLIGVDLFEEKPNVIDTAVDQRMAHLRTFQTGPRSKYCEELLNKVSAARITLLDPQKKAAYDAKLKEKLDGESGKSKRPIARALPLEEPLATATPLESPAVGAPFDGAVSGPQVRSDSSRHRGHRKKSPPWVALGIGGALLAVVAIVAMMAMSGGDEQAARRPKKSATKGILPPSPPAVVDGEPSEIDPPAKKSSAGSPAKKNASPTELPTYLRPEQFGKTPASVAKRKQPPVNPFDVKPSEQDPPPVAAKQPVTAERPIAAKPPVVARPKRLAIPTDEALKKANAEIRTVFDFKAATNVKAKTKLTQEVLATAVETGNDSASRYAMLKMARDMSVHLGDYATAEQVIDEMSQRFDIDTFEMRSKAVVKALTAKVSAEQRAKATRAGLALAKEFHKADRYKEAATIISAVGRAAARLKDTQLVADAKQLAIAGRAMAKQYGAVRRAIEKLKTTPDDPAANTSVGKYLCFAKGDWERGLPMLAKGDDAKVKELASKEKGGTEDAKEQVGLADAWWEIGKKKANQSYREILPHAADWYRKALPQLTGLAKAKVEKRLEAIEESVASNGAPGHPADAVRYGRHWYKVVVSGSIAWDDAKQRCEKAGGNLACLETLAEGKAISAFVARTGGFKKFVCLGGFRDPKGQWKWINGRRITYSLFSAKGPDNAGGVEDRLVISYKGEWHDIAGKNKAIHGYVCEWDR